MKKINLTLMAISLALLLFSCGESTKNGSGSVDNDFEKIEQEGKLVAVTEFSPTDYFVYRGEPMGYQYELLQSLADYLDLKLELVVEDDLDKKYEDLNSGEYDLVAVNMAITSERKKYVNFTDPIIQTQQVLVQRKAGHSDNKVVRNQINLGGKVVYVQKGTAYVDRLKNLSEEIGEKIHIIELPKYTDEQLIEMVANGDIDYTVTDKHIAQANAHYFSNIDVKTPISFPQNLAWAVRKSSKTLLDTINYWMEGIKRSMEYRAIYEKYFENQWTIYVLKNNFYSQNNGRVSEFDDLIKEQSKKLDWDWRLLASLVYQESRFKPDVESWAGAFGLMQLMPATASRYGVTQESSYEENVKAGVSFLKWLDEHFDEKVKNNDEKIKFILASYNAGLGHILDARRLARKNGKNPNVWEDNVDQFVLHKSEPEVYQDPVVKHGYLRGTETYNYVNDIMDRFHHYKNIYENQE